MGFPTNLYVINNPANIAEEHNPTNFKLYQNYPNPFNPVTTIKYSIPFKGFVDISVYDILGKKIDTLYKDVHLKGKYEVTFNGEQLPSGIYIYYLKFKNFQFTKKMLLLK